MRGGNGEGSIKRGNGCAGGGSKRKLK